MTITFKELVNAFENYQKLNKKSLRDLDPQEIEKQFESSRKGYGYMLPAHPDEVKEYDEAEKALIKALDDYIDDRILKILSARA